MHGGIYSNLIDWAEIELPCQQFQPRYELHEKSPNEELQISLTLGVTSTSKRLILTLDRHEAEYLARLLAQAASDLLSRFQPLINPPRTDGPQSNSPHTKQ